MSAIDNAEMDDFMSFIKGIRITRWKRVNHD